MCVPAGFVFALFTVDKAVRSTCGKSRDDDEEEEDDHFQKLRFHRGFSSCTRATDVDFGKMTIQYVLIGCTRGTLATDVDFGKMTI